MDAEKRNVCISFACNVRKFCLQTLTLTLNQSFAIELFVVKQILGYLSGLLARDKIDLNLLLVSLNILSNKRIQNEFDFVAANLQFFPLICAKTFGRKCFRESKTLVVSRLEFPLTIQASL